MSQELLTTDEAATYLRVSEPHLRKLRQRRDGPPFIRIGGRIIYRREAIDAFLMEREGRS